MTTRTELAELAIECGMEIDCVEPQFLHVHARSLIMMHDVLIERCAAAADEWERYGIENSSAGLVRGAGLCADAIRAMKVSP